MTHTLDALQRGGNWVWAVCSCGWNSPMRRLDYLALDLWHDHVATETESERHFSH